MKAPKGKTVRLLKTVRGQIDGVLKMIEEDQYCMDIVNQILASDAILRKTVREILHAHMSHCVSEAIETGDAAARDEKIDEMMSVLEKLSR